MQLEYAAVLVSVVSILPMSSSHWWQFGAYVEKNYLEHGVFVPIQCDNMNLPTTQLSLCKDPRNEKLMTHLGLAINLAVTACNNSFNCSRWNCPYSGNRNLLGPLIGHGNRETAVAHAITSAFAAYTITRDCAQQKLTGCGCDSTRRSDASLATAASDVLAQHPNARLSWKGCSEDVQYGYSKSKEFVDAAEEETRQEKKLMNLHNNEAGRLAVKNELVLRCRCHGVSYACNVQTCWYEMKHWNDVGAEIKLLYDKAVKVTVNAQSGKLEKANGKEPGSEEMIYVNETQPDLCDLTKGRKCYKKDSSSECSCDVLCCQRGYNTVPKTIVENCKCKLRMSPPPIRIVCNKCQRDIEDYYCRK